MGNSLNSVINRIAALTKDDPATVLHRLYCEELKPPGEISRLLLVSDSTVPKLLTFFGIPRRTVSETLKIAWERNAARRYEQAERMRSVNQRPHPQPNHWSRGRTKFDHPSLARIADKAREAAVAKRPGMSEKYRAAIKKRHQERPETHVLAKVPMTKWEALFAQRLTQHGIRYVFNAHFPPYWVDFYLPDYHAGIELYRNKAQGMVWSRHKAIEAQGITLYYLWTTRLKSEWQKGKPKSAGTATRDQQIVTYLLRGITTGRFPLHTPREKFFIAPHG